MFRRLKHHSSLSWAYGSYWRLSFLQLFLITTHQDYSDLSLQFYTWLLLWRSCSYNYCGRVHQQSLVSSESTVIIQHLINGLEIAFMVLSYLVCTENMVLISSCQEQQINISADTFPRRVSSKKFLRASMFSLNSWASKKFVKVQYFV